MHTRETYKEVESNLNDERGPSHEVLDGVTGVSKGEMNWNVVLMFRMRFLNFEFWRENILEVLRTRGGRRPRAG